MLNLRLTNLSLIIGLQTPKICLYLPNAEITHVHPQVQTMWVGTGSEFRASYSHSLLTEPYPSSRMYFLRRIPSKTIQDMVVIPQLKKSRKKDPGCEV